MANKPTPWVLPEPVTILVGNPCIDWYGYRESPTFSIGYGDGYGDVHIPAISPLSFKLLKYSQLIKDKG